VPLILLDSGKHADWYEKITGDGWHLGEKSVKLTNGETVGGRRTGRRALVAPYDPIFSRNFRAIQTEWTSINIFGLDPALDPTAVACCLTISRASCR
jgi:hypothetical protein